MPEMISEELNILIIGTGQIGYAVFEELNKFNYSRIVLHCYSKEEIIVLKRKINKEFPNIKMNIHFEYGDIYQSEPIENIQSVQKTKLYRICEKWEINYIVDCINTAAVLGEELDELNKSLNHHSLPSNNINVIEKLNNFIITLKEVYQFFKMKKYIKVSTTGLGGMGLNMGYTHGDVQGLCLSPDILGKLQVSGAYHQLLWALNRTPNYNISVVIPSACIGWEDVKNDFLPKFNSQLSEKIIDIYGIKRNIQSFDVKKDISITQVYLGENNSYSKEEVALLTQINQMEFVSKQRIARIVVNDLLGRSSNHNLLSLMDYSMITPSYKEYYLRDILLNDMSKKADLLEVESLVTNNLGKEVAIDIIELFLVKQLLNGDLKNLSDTIKKDNNDIFQELMSFFSQNSFYRDYFLSMNYAIVFDYEICWISKENSEQRFIDVINCKSENIRNILNNLIEIRQYYSDTINFDFERYYLDILDSDNFSVGEMLGIFYSFNGKGRVLVMENNEKETIGSAN